MKFSREECPSYFDISNLVNLEIDITGGSVGESTENSEMWPSNIFGYNQFHGKASMDMFPNGRIQAGDSVEGVQSPGDDLSDSSNGSPVIGGGELYHDSSENVQNGFAQPGYLNGMFSTSENTLGYSTSGNGFGVYSSNHIHTSGPLNAPSQNVSFNSDASRLEHNNMKASHQGNQVSQSLWLESGQEQYHNALGTNAVVSSADGGYIPGWENLYQSRRFVPSRDFDGYHHEAAFPSLPLTQNQNLSWNGQKHNSPTAVSGFSFSSEYMSDTLLSAPTLDGSGHQLTDHLVMVDRSRYSSDKQRDIRPKKYRKTVTLEETNVDGEETSVPVLGDTPPTPTYSDEEYDEEPSEDDDAIEQSVRKDPLYDREPDKDGLYRCPFLDEENCSHPPTKLKCNYDKYIDSHLKPHRCKSAECKDLRFSSTACRLRHEREAHGSHGHGVKPFLCKYSDCERSKPGMGFPRSWNCNDHMRRMHDHPLSPSGDSADSPGETGRTNPKGPSTKKRKASESESKQHGKKASANGRNNDANEAAKAAEKNSLKTLVLQQWKHQYGIIHRHVHALSESPYDTASVELLHKETYLLAAISKRLADFE